MKVLINTNVISELTPKDPNRKVIQFLNSLNEDDNFISVITLREIKRGILKCGETKKQRKLETFLEELIETKAIVAPALL